jgi:hypothetical protein
MKTKYVLRGSVYYVSKLNSQIFLHVIVGQFQDA